MSLSSRPRVFTIAAHKAFADALAAGLIARFGREKTGLARGLVLLPNNRAVQAVTAAFVRRSEGGLLLPRLVPIGDDELDMQVGGALDPLGNEEEGIPPAVAPIERLLVLARLVQEHLPGDVDAAEALRLAEDLARSLDQLLVEELDPARLRAFAVDLPDLSIHWQKSLDRLEMILAHWPRHLASRGRIDLVERRNRLLSAVARRWRSSPPSGYVVAAGITTAAPAVARLLRVVASLDEGMVVLPALDLAMPEEELEALGPHEPDPDTGRRRRAIETHPQFHLKLQLDRMGVARAEVAPWRWGGGRDAPAARGRAIAHAMAPAIFTSKWQELPPAQRRLGGVRALELGDPAEEAQAIALAMRGALEVPGRTAALVTPDRALARRVTAHLRRWGVEADDSAGRPLAQTPAGTLLLAIATAAVERFAPVALLTLLKHPLVQKGPQRLDWLDGARALDLALRGPRPPAGLDAIADHLTWAEPRERAVKEAAAAWWPQALQLLKPLERAFESPARSLSDMVAAVREAASALAGDHAWTGPAGKSAAELVAALEPAADQGPRRVDTVAFPAFLERLMQGVAVRPPYGQHPRLFIWGLLEARLQHADLMILGGLNEGVWPALPAPDPWLAPRIRHEFGLPSLDRRIGLAAHDFACALGSREVLITRPRRDARAPAVASRFWLRLEAMTGGITRAPALRSWTRALDRPPSHLPAERPAPAPPADLRPRRIAVTDVDRLKADPYAFYAKTMLGLAALDGVDADPTAAWRGSAVHRILEAWMKQDECDPQRLRPRAEALLSESSAHPLMRALWQPRLLEAIDWIVGEVTRNAGEGRRPLRAEAYGRCQIGEVALFGYVDRIDRLADGSLAIVDYKTGRAPSGKAVAGGYAMQLGLLGLIAEHGGFDEVDGTPTVFEYWSLAKDRGKLGYVVSPVGGRQAVAAEDFTAVAASHFHAAAAAWLTGAEPFTAKLNPAFAPYGDYDQLMRLGEWYGR